MEYDVFISHASEDKASVARPLAAHLQGFGLRVWLDEFELTLGDSLRRKIDRGLSLSRFGVVILSRDFFLKEWPNKELDGLVAREDGREKVILPVWHNISFDDIVKFSPVLAGKLAVSTSSSLVNVARQIHNAVLDGGDGDGPGASRLVPNEEDLLEDLRMRMLSANSSRELRATLYEAEQYLARYPQSPQARLLQDTLREAMSRAEAMEQQRARRDSRRRMQRTEYRRARGLPIFGLLLRIALGAGAVYALYSLIRMFFG